MCDIAWYVYDIGYYLIDEQHYSGIISPICLFYTEPSEKVMKLQDCAFMHIESKRNTMVDMMSYEYARTLLSLLLPSSFKIFSQTFIVLFHPCSSCVAGKHRCDYVVRHDKKFKQINTIIHDELSVWEKYLLVPFNYRGLAQTFIFSLLWKFCCYSTTCFFKVFFIIGCCYGIYCRLHKLSPATIHVAWIVVSIYCRLHKLSLATIYTCISDNGTYWRHPF